MRKRMEKQLEILNGWKEIANYMGKGVRTVQRYERDLNLPIRRPAGKPTGAVIATRAEIDAWITASPIRHAFQLPKAGFDSTALKTLTSNVAALSQLRKETVQLRESLRMSLDQLGETLRLTVPEMTPAALRRQTAVATSEERKTLADVLTFNPGKRKFN